jgi:PEP-CTERM motif-containing protein
MRGKIIAGAVVALGLLSSPAFATNHDLGELDPTTFDSASLTGKLPASGTTFTEDYTFTLTTTGLVSPGVIITSAAGPGRLPTKTDVELCQGGPTTDCTASEPLVISGSAASVTLATLKLDGGAGSPTYYLVFTGTSKGNMSVGGTVSTSPSVPEPATWAMMLLGFTGLGYAAFRRSAKGRGVLAI